MIYLLWIGEYFETTLQLFLTKIKIQIFYYNIPYYEKLIIIMNFRLRNTGPLLVEIDRGNEITDLGLSLVDSPTGVIVSRVRTAGIAER